MGTVVTLKQKKENRLPAVLAGLLFLLSGMSTALAKLSPDDAMAIVAAVNAVPGVNTNAVAAAVQFGPGGHTAGPQSLEIEHFSTSTSGK